MDHPYKTQALAEIRTHLQENGSRDWDPLRHRMNFIGQATFWRWVKLVKKQIPSELIATSSRQRVRDHTSTSHGAGRRFDLRDSYHALWTDATTLRIRALRCDDPAHLSRSILVRLRLLRQALKLESQIFSASAQQRFFDALIEEVARESPALHARLVSRLRAFRSQFDAEQSGEARQVEP